MKFPNKHPDSILDYVIDWSSFLDGDTISTSVWSVPSDLTKSNESNTTTTTTCFLGGGTANKDYTITNTITTAAGRTVVKSFELPVKP